MTKQITRLTAAAVILSGLAGCAALEKPPGESRTHSHPVRVGHGMSRRQHVLPPMPAPDAKPEAARTGD